MIIINPFPMTTYYIFLNYTVSNLPNYEMYQLMYYFRVILYNTESYTVV